MQASFLAKLYGSGVYWTVFVATLASRWRRCYSSHFCTASSSWPVEGPQSEVAVTDVR